MAGREPYPTASGVESAIKEAAKAAAAADPSAEINKLIQLEYFNRFLSRVFSEGEDSEWVLKGGTGILARLPSTRTTRDIDLYRQGFTLPQALDDLNRLATVDLQDHFRFEYAGHTSSIGNDAQPYTEGYRVKFRIFIGVSPKGTLQVDLVIGAGVTGDIVTTNPATSLNLPRLVNNAYRLYPVVDQIADKVCATMAEYNDKTSSREKGTSSTSWCSPRPTTLTAPLCAPRSPPRHDAARWTRSNSSTSPRTGEPAMPSSASQCPTALTTAPSASPPNSSHGS